MPMNRYNKNNINEKAQFLFGAVLYHILQIVQNDNHHFTIVSILLLVTVICFILVNNILCCLVEARN